VNYFWVNLKSIYACTLQELFQPEFFANPMPDYAFIAFISKID